MSIVADHGVSDKVIYFLPDGEEVTLEQVLNQRPPERRESFREALEWLGRCDGWDKSYCPSERNSLAGDIARELLADVGLTPEEAVEAVMLEYSAECLPAWPREKWQRCIDKVAATIARWDTEGSEARTEGPPPPVSPAPKPGGGGWFRPKPLDGFEAIKGDYIIQGLLPEGMATLFSAQAKCGKTTLLAHLLRAMEEGGTFCGLAVKRTRAVIISEENEGLWVKRCENLGLPGSWHYGQCLPFLGKPKLDQWTQGIQEIATWVKKKSVGLVIFDTIGNLGPGSNENDNGETQSFLAPLREICRAGAAVLCFHHHGWESEHARGASALAGFADVNIDMVRTNKADDQDRRRTLKIKGRLSDLMGSVVIELEDGSMEYQRAEDLAPTPAAKKKGALNIIQEIAQLAPESGWTCEEFLAHWPADRKKPKLKAIENAASAGKKSGALRCVVEGKPGQPARYTKPIESSPPPDKTPCLDQGEEDAGQCPWPSEAEKGTGGNAQGEVC